MRSDIVNEEIKKLLEEKLEEITNEYQVILKNNIDDLNYINICTHQYNAIRKVLEELMQELSQKYNLDNNVSIVERVDE